MVYLTKRNSCRILTSWCVLVLVCTGTLPAVAAYDDALWSVTRTNGISYGQGRIGAGSKDLQLDLYQPTGSTDANKPGVVLIHGGGFTGGSRGSMAFLGEHFASRGYLAVSISYRLLGENPVADPDYVFFVPELAGAVHAAAVDAKRAVRWMRANAESLGLDPDIIFLGGISAGAFTSMHAGISDDTVFLTELPGDTPLAINNPGETAQVAAILDFCGGAMPEYFDEDDPPILIVHTTGDTTVPVAAADIVEQQCLAYSIPHEYYRLPGGSHCSFFSGLIDGLSVYDLTTRFLNDKVWEVAPPGPEAEMISVRKLVLRDDHKPPFNPGARKLTFLAKSRAGGTLPPLAPAAGSAADPTLHGAQLELYSPTDTPGEVLRIDLPAAAWKSVGAGGSSGYRYADARGAHGPRMRARLRDGLLKIAGRGEEFRDLKATPLAELTLRLRLGSSLLYCAPTQVGRHDSASRWQAQPYAIPANDCPAPPYGSPAAAFLDAPASLLY
jgi:acetyl esterase/lipase